MITTDINRAEFTGNGVATDYVFASGVNIPVKDQAHIKVYLTNTGTFTANASTEVFTNVTLDGVAQTSHGHLDTEIIRISAGTTLPAGLIINTDYYIRDKTSTTFKLALTSGGGVVPITDTGTGTLTWTKTLLQVLTTAYTVSISGTTATVTFLTPPPNTVGILLIREVPFEQNTDLLNNSLIEAESLESQLDLIVNQTQQLKNTFDRQLKFSEILDAVDATETAVTLNVTSANRASKGLKFDASGNLAVSDIDIDQSQDYTLEAQSWATESPAAVNTYTDSVSSPVSPTAYSSKEHAVGDATPSAKNYATKVNGGIPTATSDHSAKAWAVGGTGVTATALKGASKEWATADGRVDHPSSGGYSAKAWATGGAGVTTTSGHGAAKEWASGSGLIDTASYSAKTYAQDTSSSADTTAGSAKGWASTAYDTAVPGAGSGDRSSLHYSTDASNSALAAKASAAAVASALDSFDDTYLGTMSNTSTQGTNPTTNGTWAKNSSAITVVSGSNIKVGQVVTGTGMPSPPPNVISVAGTAVVVSENMAALGSAVALTFTGYGVYGTYSGTGPTTDNDNGALADGMLYFNSTSNNMMVYKTTGSAWVAASSSGDTSLLVHKYTYASSTATSVLAAQFTPTLSYTPENIIVFLNGVRLEGGGVDYVATNGNDILSLAALAVDDEVVVIAYKSFDVANTVSTSGGTFAGAVTFSAVPVFSAGVGAITGTTIDATTDFTVGGTIITDATITDNGTLTITATTGITLGQDTALSAGKDLETSTTGKVKQKGAFMQSSTHQALTLGY